VLTVFVGKVSNRNDVKNTLTARMDGTKSVARISKTSAFPKQINFGSHTEDMKMF